MERNELIEQYARAVEALAEWEARWGPAEPAAVTRVSPERISAVLAELVERLHANYPYGHPRYAGQMLKPPHPVAALAAAVTMLLNPNNHALDAGRATSAMEREAVAQLATMFGYPDGALGHLTGGGTIANLEALWVARHLQPGKAIAASDQAHYTHTRACDLLGVPFVSVPSDRRGRMDVTALRERLASGDIGTVVATLGTTGLGALDPLHEILPLAREYGARVHVDAAYGGFYALLAQREWAPIDARPFRAIAQSDSVVVDPHKHGLQPYGCGAVLFRDPAIGRVYVHDSPYTYFTSSELHLGEISLECSRAGAAAAALWATLACLPLEPEAGLGAILAECRAAALRWAELLRDHSRLRLVVEPELDIVCFYALPIGERVTASNVSALTDALFAALEQDADDPVFLAKMTVRRELLAERAPVDWDVPEMRVLRSVLMKPEHREWVLRLHAAVERALARVDAG